MNELQIRVKTAFEWLRKIPVADESVDHMAAARLALNDAFKLAGELIPEEEEKANG